MPKLICLILSSGFIIVFWYKYMFEQNFDIFYGHIKCYGLVGQGQQMLWQYGTFV